MENRQRVVNAQPSSTSANALPQAQGSARDEAASNELGGQSLVAEIMRSCAGLEQFSSGNAGQTQVESQISVGNFDQRQISITTNHYDLSLSIKAQVGKIVNGKGKEDFASEGDNLHADEFEAIDRKFQRLKSFLNQRAAAESGKSPIPIKPIDANLRLTRLPLQLTTKTGRELEHLDREGQYNKRSEFEIVLKSPKGDIKFGEIFRHAFEIAEEKAKIETSNEAAERKFVDHYGNLVALIGQAGIGKTTLARMMLQHVLNGETLPETEFLFFIPFRDMNFDSETTLLKFALTGCYDWEYSLDSDRRLLKSLHENPNVVFVFDGLDEASTDQLSKYTPGCDLYDSQKTNIFVARILTGDFFPKAKKFITSRPRQLFELHEKYLPLVVIDILGFDRKAQEDMCRQICGDFFADVMSYLKAHPDIFACCYVPVNCSITMSIINKTLRAKGKIDVQSLTHIFIEALEAFVESEHMRKHCDQVWKFSKLAWSGFSVKKIVFSEADIKEADIEPKVFDAFLRAYVVGNVKGSILQGKKKSSFTQLTWQELFVAIYLMIFHSLHEFRDLIDNDNLSKPLWEVVSKFLYGLCNPIVRRKLETVLDPEVSKDWKAKKTVLSDFIIRCLQKNPLDSETFLRLSTWIHEADDVDMNKFVAPHIPDHVTLQGSILPTDAVNASYVLKLSTKPVHIQFAHNVNISLHDFHFLCEKFSELRVKIVNLRLDYYNVGDEDAKAVAKCLNNVEQLEMRSCGLTATGMEVFAHSFHRASVKRLNLAYNDKFGDASALALSKYIYNLEELDVSGCGITAAGVGYLAAQIEQYPVKELHLSGNHIGDAGAIHLSRCLSNIEVLVLWRCEINAVGVKAIAEQLQSQKLKKLHLGGNEMNDEALACLCNCLGNIDVLNVEYNKLTAVGMTTLADKLMSLDHPLKGLHLPHNEIRDEGLELICQGLRNVEELDLSYTEITDSGVKKMALKIALLSLPIKSLHLGGNELKDEGLAALCDVLNWIEELDVRATHLNDTRVKMLCARVASLPQPIRKLNISQNPISDEGANYIAGCLKNVEKLDFSWCDLTNAGVKTIELELSRLPSTKPVVVGLIEQKAVAHRRHAS